MTFIFTYYFRSRHLFLREKVFLEILQNSQENTCARVSFLIKLQACVHLNILFVAGILTVTNKISNSITERLGKEEEKQKYICKANAF